MATVMQIPNSPNDITHFAETGTDCVTASYSRALNTIFETREITLGA